MNNAGGEPSHIAPSDGYYGGGAKTTASYVHAPGEEVASGANDGYSGYGGYNQGPPPPNPYQYQSTLLFFNLN
jgi:hypothetical protein